MDGDLANARADRRSGISDTDSARSWHSDNGCRWRSDSRLSCWSTAPTLHRVRPGGHCGPPGRSEEHTSELQSLMRISYAVFCLKKKTIKKPSQSSTKPLFEVTLHYSHTLMTRHADHDLTFTNPLHLVTDCNLQLFLLILVRSMSHPVTPEITTSHVFTSH